jgi:hypothetical protein
MNIRWTEEATANLEHISLYIAEDNPEAALQTVNTIYERIEQLRDFPNRGRIGREKGTRERQIPTLLIAQLLWESDFPFAGGTCVFALLGFFSGIPELGPGPVTSTFGEDELGMHDAPAAGVIMLDALPLI